MDFSNRVLQQVDLIGNPNLVFFAAVVDVEVVVAVVVVVEVLLPISKTLHPEKMLASQKHFNFVGLCFYERGSIRES